MPVLGQREWNHLMKAETQKPTNHLAPWTLLGKTPPGTCPECAVNHPPEQPHNQQSLAYQYKFYEQQGRWPTWTDALAHCGLEVQEHWKTELRKHGVKI